MNEIRRLSDKRRPGGGGPGLATTTRTRASRRPAGFTDEHQQRLGNIVTQLFDTTAYLHTKPATRPEAGQMLVSSLLLRVQCGPRSMCNVLYLVDAPFLLGDTRKRTAACCTHTKCTLLT